MNYEFCEKRMTSMATKGGRLLQISRIFSGGLFFSFTWKNTSNDHFIVLWGILVTDARASLCLAHLWNNVRAQQFAQAAHDEHFNRMGRISFSARVLW